MNALFPVIAALVALLGTGLLGYFIIPLLHKLKFGQTILDIGPSWHKEKQGTPTMGGIMMVLGLILALAVSLSTAMITRTGYLYEELQETGRMRLAVFALTVGLAICTGFIGFIDDYIKVAKKRNLGLTAMQKTVLQLLVTAAFLAGLRLTGVDSTWLPFVGTVQVVSGWGLLYWPIALLFIYGFTNAVNLTDGVDGLATTVTLVVAMFFMIASGLLGYYLFNTLSAAVAGVCAGFLLWNAHPAKVFMGDTGSMFLGGMVCGLAFAIGRPILLILAGIVYLMEAFSVILQVAYYKRTKKRIFKMTPIHHHFEMCGWKEEKVVIVFALITVIGCCLATFLLLQH